MQGPVDELTARADQVESANAKEHDLAVAREREARAELDEQSLRPGRARSGRTVAAVGAALVAGSLIGEVAARFIGIADGRRAAGAVRDERDRQQARIDAPQDATKEANTDAERYAQLAREFQPLPSDAAARPRVDDGRLDIAGASVGAAARALHQAYDMNDDDLLGMDEQQRAIDGGSASIATLLADVYRAKSGTDRQDGEPITATVADLEQVIADRVDVGGTNGVIDNDEATAWFGPIGAGEKAHVWSGASAFLASIKDPSFTPKESTAKYAPGPWRAGGDDILYLTEADDLTTAKRQLAELSTDGNPAALLVALPEGAPSTYGVVSLFVDGEAGYKPYDDVMKALQLDSSVVAGRGCGEVFDI